MENAQDVQARAVVCAVSAKTKYQMEDQENERKGAFSGNVGQRLTLVQIALQQNQVSH